jgi:hypothetical protein
MNKKRERTKRLQDTFLVYKQQTPLLLVRKQIIPTERPPLVGEVSANFLRIEGVASPRPLNSVF